MNNRSEGWRHAKLSGHSNEDLIAELLISNTDFNKRLAKKCKLKFFNTVSIGGINETNVNSVLGGTTKSKTDLIAVADNNKSYNFSIKKSFSGQVFLIKPDRFIKGFEIHYQPIPKNIQKAINLFFGGDKQLINKILNSNCYSVDEKIKSYEKRKCRLTAQTLKAYDKKLADDLLHWFYNNSKYIADFCFARGLASNRCNWSKYLWYKNLIGEHDVDEIFSIDELCEACNVNSKIKDISYGTRGGGTTIQLPFGFVQWHLHSIQFHHSYKKIKSILNNN